MTRLEKLINPLLDDNDKVAFNYLLRQAIEHAMLVPKSFIFHAPVDVKRVR